MAETLGQGIVEVTGDASGAIRAIDSTQSHLGASIFIFRTAGYALQAIGQAALSGFSQASQASADFNQKLVQIQNLSSIADLNVKTMHDDLLKLAIDTGRAPQEIADGFYYAASVLTNFNDALTVTTVAAKGSAIGLGSVGDVTRILTSIMNVYGLKAADVNGLMNTLIIAVKDGAGEVDQFAGAFGRIIPIAKVAGVSFNDVAAALATATRAGLSVDEATTAVTRTLTELIGSTTNTNKMLMTLGFSSKQITEAMKDLAIETGTTSKRLTTYGLTAQQAQIVVEKLSTSHALAEKAMKQYGLTNAQIQSVEAGHTKSLDTLRKQLIPYGMSLQDINTVLKAYSKDTEEGRLALGKYGISSQELRDTLKGPNGLYNALTMIMEKTGGNDAELRKIFPNIRGFIGILATAGTQGAEYKSILDEMNGALGTTDTAFKKAADTQAFANAQYKAALDVLKIRVGEALAPTMIAVLKALLPMLQAVSDFSVQHPTAFKVITLGLLGLAAGLTAVGGALQGVAGIIAVTRAFGWLITNASKLFIVEGALTGLGEAFAAAGAFMLGTGGAIILIIAGIILIGYLLITHWKQLSDTVSSLGTLLGTFFVEIWAKVRNAIGGFFDWLGTQAHAKVQQVGDAFSAFGTRVHAIWDGIVAGVGAAIMAIVRWFMDTPKHLGQAAHAIGFFIGRLIRDQIIDPFLKVVKFFQDLPLNIEIALVAIPIIISTVWEIAKAAVKQRLHDILKVILDHFGAIVGNIQYFSEHWKDILGNAWENVKKAVMDKIGGLVTWLSSTWNGISKAAKAIWDNLPAIASTSFGILVETIKGVLNLMKDDIIGPNGIFQHIVDYLKDLGSKLYTIAADIAGQFWDGIKKGLDKHSPSNVERAFFDIGDAAKNSVENVRGAIRTLNSLAPQGLVSGKSLAMSTVGGPSAASTATLAAAIGAAGKSSSNRDVLLRIENLLNAIANDSPPLNGQAASQRLG